MRSTVAPFGDDAKALKRCCCSNSFDHHHHHPTFSANDGDRPSVDVASEFSYFLPLVVVKMERDYLVEKNKGFL